MISTKEFSIDNTGSIDVTNKLQEIIDYASDKKEMLKIEAGIYLIFTLIGCLIFALIASIKQLL